MFPVRPFLFCALVTTLAAGSVQARADTRADCTDSNGYSAICGCSQELGHVLEGKPYDESIFLSDLGNEDPRVMFSRGGSMNIPVVCRAGKYLVDHDPAWFDAYFDVQAEEALPGLMGTEILSSLYVPSNIGAVLAVLSHAADRGHAGTAARAGDWLRAVWALLALNAMDAQIASGTILQHSTDEPVDGNGGWFDGASAVVAGMRASKGGAIGPSSLFHPLLSMAIGHPERRCGYGLFASPGFYGGMRHAAAVAGYSFDSRGHVDLGSLDPPASVFGLTDGERAALLRFVRSGGAEAGGEVVAMVGSFRPSCDMTFRRTTEGVTSWFGTSTSSQRFCNRNKGPYAAARMDTTGHAVYLRPTQQTNPAEGGEVYREGDRICARLDTGHVRCMEMLGGDVLYELSWTKRGGLMLVDGSVEPVAPPEDDDAAVVAVDVPSRVEPGQAFTARITMRNTGASTWTRAGEYKLGSQMPMDNVRFGLARVDLEPTDRVAPGAEHAFVLELTAPGEAGVVPFQWQMVREHVHWFGEPTPLRQVGVGMDPPAEGTTDGGATGPDGGIPATDGGSEPAAGGEETSGGCSATGAPGSHRVTWMLAAVVLWLVRRRAAVRSP